MKIFITAKTLKKISKSSLAFFVLSGLALIITDHSKAFYEKDEVGTDMNRSSRNFLAPTNDDEMKDNFLANALDKEDSICANILKNLQTLASEDQEGQSETEEKKNPDNFSKSVSMGTRKSKSIKLFYDLANNSHSQKEQRKNEDAIVASMISVSAGGVF